MREINIGGKEIRVRANPLALLFYKQEFKRDAIGDLATMFAPMMAGGQETDPLTMFKSIDSINLLQLIWAMNKADAPLNSPFPSFEGWISELEYFDLADANSMTGLVEEAMAGFFRTGQQATAIKAGAKKKP